MNYTLWALKSDVKGAAKKFTLTTLAILTDADMRFLMQGVRTSHEDLAEITGQSAEEVTEQLQALEQEGYIEVKQHSDGPRYGLTLKGMES